MDARKDIEVTYTKANGFIGLYSYEGSSGEITEDVTLKATFFNIGSTGFSIEGYIGDNNGITMEGTNFGQIKFSTSKISEDGQFIIDNGSLHFSNLTIRPEKGTFNILRGSFKNDGTRFSFPTQLVGELEMKRFFDTSPVRSNQLLEYNKKVFSRGDNALAGVFVADKTNEVAIRSFPLRVSSEGNIGMFSYGLWADELPQECGFSSCSPSPHYRAELSIPRGEIFYPVTPLEEISNLPGQFARDSIDVIYKKEGGFRGAYIYKDQIGTIESDVHLAIAFSSKASGGRGSLSVRGFLAKPFEMEGDSFQGIVLQGLSVNYRDASLEQATWTSGNNAIRFGTANFSSVSKIPGSISAQGNIQEQGTFSLNFAATGGQRGESVSLENYPKHIGGEIKVTGFSLDETGNYADNTIVGVFVGDRDSARNPNENKVIE